MNKIWSQCFQIKTHRSLGNRPSKVLNTSQYRPYYHWISRSVLAVGLHCTRNAFKYHVILKTIHSSLLLENMYWWQHISFGLFNHHNTWSKALSGIPQGKTIPMKVFLSCSMNLEVDMELPILQEARLKNKYSHSKDLHEILPHGKDTHFW